MKYLFLSVAIAITLTLTYSWFTPIAIPVSDSIANSDWITTLPFASHTECKINFAAGTECDHRVIIDARLQFALWFPWALDGQHHFVSPY